MCGVVKGELATTPDQLDTKHDCSVFLCEECVRADLGRELTHFEKRVCIVCREQLDKTPYYPDRELFKLIDMVSWCSSYSWRYVILTYFLTTYTVLLMLCM